MSDWYYAGTDRQTRGPVDRQALLDAIANGSVADGTLLWQEGWPNWRPLSECRDLLGLTPAPPAPPPLPPRMPPPMAVARPTSAPPPGMSSRAVLLLVLGVGGLMALFVIAILAAIALPAYQEYLSRSRLAQVAAQAAPLRAQIDSVLEAGGDCPSNDSDGFKPADAYASTYVQSILVGEFDDDSCGLELVVSGTGRQPLDGKRLWWARGSDGQWVCSSEIEDRYLPPQCRG